METLSDVWDFEFYWNVFEYMFKLVAPWALIPIAIMSVGLLLYVLVSAVSSFRRS